jgi:hypothetical protein
MTHMNLKKERTPPLWAVLGAPLIVVPIMVGLLALAGPDSEGPITEPVPAVVTEPLDTHLVEPASNDSGLDREGAHRRLVETDAVDSAGMWYSRVWRISAFRTMRPTHRSP